MPLIFLVLNYLFTTIGEMTVSPVGLSQQTKLAPITLVSTMMALWFTGTAWAQYAGGLITKSMGSTTIGGHVIDAKASLATTLSTFNTMGLVVIAFGVVLFALSFAVKSWAHGANDSVAD